MILRDGVYVSLIGAVLLWLGYYHLSTVKKRKRLVRKLKEKEQFFNALFEYNPVAISIYDRIGRSHIGNAAAVRTTGVYGEDFYDMVLKTNVERRPGEGRGRDAVFEDQPYHFETSIVHKKGYNVDLSVTTVPIHVEGETTGVITIAQDITETNRTLEQIKHMAYYDDLTGIPNRRLFRDSLEQAISLADAANSTVVVLYLDIDRFKLINDSLGHDFGDMLLLQIAERLTRCVSYSDFVARMDGDEFGMFYPGIPNIDEAQQIAQNILETLEEPFQLQEYKLHITASIGISIYTYEHEDASVLMKYADIALSKAKEQGKNNFQLYKSSMNVRSLERLTLENELRRALQNDEFLLLYQPQMDIYSGEIVGVEALIRWQHPVRGTVSPSEFIPLAEENGLIVSIGEWVLRKACKQNKAWQDAGYKTIPVSVNLSTRQFLESNLTSKIAQVLQETGLEPQYLELEITESMMMDVEYATGALLELQKLGVHISMDDFGTGYSSLSYLKNFPITKLKIDKSFVRDIMVDPNDAAIVTAIIAMARHLNHKVIAEGVETVEQLAFLSSHGCNEVQGYYFSPPISVSAFEQMYCAYEMAAADKE